jgi:hypothetical protein
MSVIFLSDLNASVDQPLLEHEIEYDKLTYGQIILQRFSFSGKTGHNYRVCLLYAFSWGYTVVYNFYKFVEDTYSPNVAPYYLYYYYLSQWLSKKNENEAWRTEKQNYVLFVKDSTVGDLKIILFQYVWVWRGRIASCDRRVIKESCASHFSHLVVYLDEVKTRNVAIRPEK